jgi:erythromycin esterase
MPTHNPSAPTSDRLTGHARTGLRWTITAICLIATSFAMASEAPHGPKPTGDSKASTAQADREANVRQGSLALLRDGIRGGMRDIRPGTRDLDEIAAGLYAGHRIIGVGEATHGTADIFTMKADLMRSLVKAGLRDIAIELSVTEAAYLDDYVCGKVTGDPGMADVMRNSRMYQSWMVPEVADMILWIRDFNAKHAGDPIRIHGIDSQMPDADRLLAILAAKAPGFDLKGAKARDAAYYTACEPFEALIHPVLKDVPSADVDRVFTARLRFIDELRTAVASIQLPTRERKLAELTLRALEQECDSSRQMFIGGRIFRTTDEVAGFLSSGTMRDVFMAENFAFTERNIIGNGARIMLWAHSGHLAKRPWLERETGAMYHPFGVFLGQWYGNQYHVTDVTVGGGTTRGYETAGYPTPPATGRKPVAFTIKPDSVEGLITSAGAKGPVFLETRGLPLRDLSLDYVLIGTEVTTKEGSGLARGTIADFDSYIFMPSGKASTDLKP